VRGETGIVEEGGGARMVCRIALFWERQGDRITSYPRSLEDIFG
jgi:hypothetical protein